MHEGGGRLESESFVLHEACILVVFKDFYEVLRYFIALNSFISKVLKIWLVFKTRVEWVGEGEKGSLKRYFIDLGELNVTWREAYFVCEGLVKHLAVQGLS